jgi:hypothetical protein
MDRIYIYLIDLPTKIHEMVTPCADGYTIYINARLSQTGMVEAYDHAMFHIVNDDFNKENVQRIEHEAHRNLHESFITSASQGRGITGVPTESLYELYRES